MALGRLLVFMGMIASGKSYLAKAWADSCSCASFNSDRVRKELAGIPVRERQPEAHGQGIYSPEFSRRTYDRLIELAREEWRQVPSAQVVLDGSYQARTERDRVLQELSGLARIVFVHCHCPEEVVKERLARRALDPTAVSDGNWEIYLRQKKRFESPSELSSRQLITLDTHQPIDSLIALLAAQLAGIGF